MKKFIISVMCILLFSCHPVTSPAFASVTENEVITLGTQQEITLCKDIAGFAYMSMQAHQNGVSEEGQLALAPRPTNQEEAMLKVLLDGIVHDANMFPIYKDEQDKKAITEKFSGVIYNMCNGRK